ncbi:CPBP family glutamic-type intramembrane protease [Flavivirga amylovorans]|uniref:CPBP family glutamic-type intramembrane protease n=1 Tax=Flavivirga amylovorans TaxID=870486 RepID=A0ABT8X6I7_9FLAO|nr:CPBP family glutamic-type intramembrane protease [Flavivirga amylovorans]MDO5989584.1 CPBP family glutamic-type intramembrane protease [Flavivirga amylovorans]
MKHNLTKDLIEFSETKLKRPVSNKTRLLEILGVVLTAIGKFIFMDYLNWRLPFVVIAIILWFFYISFRYKKEKGVIKYWGFRTDNFKKALKLMVPFSIVSLILIIGIGYFQNTINLTWHILPLLITYPIWGSVQQFLIIGLVAGNLNDLNSKKLNKSLIIVITAFLFSIVHFPSMWLMIGTFILALFYGYVYLKVKNIYAMGIFHGWLGALFYYTVVNQDPFQDVFLIFLN